MWVGRMFGGIFGDFDRWVEKNLEGLVSLGTERRGFFTYDEN